MAIPGNGQNRKDPAREVRRRKRPSPGEVRDRHQLDDEESADIEDQSRQPAEDPAPDRVVFDENKVAK